MQPITSVLVILIVSLFLLYSPSNAPYFEVSLSGGQRLETKGEKTKALAELERGRISERRDPDARYSQSRVLPSQAHCRENWPVKTGLLCCVRVCALFGCLRGLATRTRGRLLRDRGKLVSSVSSVDLEGLRLDLN